MHPTTTFLPGPSLLYRLFSQGPCWAHFADGAMVFSRLSRQLLCCVCLLLPVVVGARPLVFGYALWWVPEAETIRALPHVDRLKFMELRLAPDGRISDRHGWPGQWTALRNAAGALGIPIDISLTMFSPEDFNALFGSPERVKRLQQEVLDLARADGVAGVHLDIEIFSTVQARATQRYRDFVVDLSRQLNEMKPQRLVSVFFNYGAEKYLYNAASLAGVGHVIVQGYDAHWLGSEVAGPLAPLQGPDVVTWEKMHATALSLGVSPQRMLMGFPTYGYEWSVKPCQPRGKRIAPGETTVFGRVHLPQAPNLRNSVVGRVLAHGANYEAQSGSAYYRVDAADGSCLVGWFEDWWTLQRKIDWVQREKLAGLAFFPLGYDESELVGFAARRFRALAQTPAQ